MDYVAYSLNSDTFALVLWDESWKSFNNCYLIRREGLNLIIDCGKAEHADRLVAALHQLGMQPGDVDALLATHGHRDHIGAHTLFPNAAKWIHERDLARVPESERRAFQPLQSDNGMLHDLQYIHLGHHTDGSIALYDPTSKVLFCGDHLCFFGEEEPSEGMITAGHALREKTRQFVTEWSRNPENREKYGFERFAAGIRCLSSFSADVLASGHGAILRGDIPGFLKELVLPG